MGICYGKNIKKPEIIYVEAIKLSPINSLTPTNSSKKISSLYLDNTITQQKENVKKIRMSDLYVCHICDSGIKKTKL